MGFGCLVLPAPAIDLAREIIAGLAEVLETGGDVVDVMQRGNDPIHVVEDVLAFGGRHPR